MSFSHQFSWFKNSNDGIITLENRLAVSSEGKCVLTDPCSNSTLSYISKRHENIYPHKDLHTKVHSNFFKIAPNWKQLKYPFVCEWSGMSTQRNTIHQLKKKNETTESCNNLDLIKETLFSVKEVHKRVHAAWLHLYEIPQRKSYADRKQSIGCCHWGLGMGKRLSGKGHKEIF